MTFGKLCNGAGIIYNVERGLVDKEGTFFYLMDTGEVKHYKFSDEAELITVLTEEIYQLRYQLGKLQDSTDYLSRRLESTQKTLRKAQAKLRDAQ